MAELTLDELSFEQKQRLAFIDFSLQYFGHISVQDLVSKFAAGLAATNQDFHIYRCLAKDNMQLNQQSHQYFRLPSFAALFNHDAGSVLHGLAKGFGDGLSQSVAPSQVCFDAISLIHPDTNVIATIMRAIQHQKAIRVTYVSTSSGESQREIVPHALVNNGQRWHIRGYDRVHKRFADFVITRIKNINGSDSEVKTEERSDADLNWQKMVLLKLIPHPSLTYPEAIELDYQMKDGELVIHSRSALAGYLLRQWSVDCSKSHHFNSGVCQLALKNHNILQDIEHTSIAPGA
ncbi:WYL domain-containing protein [Parashewanella spongiae]|uniref:WYL domain-containing protein n=1 Tax=Parashewanella spongiae TaxID=342950 RepID=A0A3A6U247_9GAMM|nr:WYL domain-containing protein [Parashewanella spongiae]MCL1077617.1 WYL domain-containing protein [Parashewanella spongiae]RJY06781.1 WYL domain-containing protein [Parashewanella spongiae]